MSLRFIPGEVTDLDRVVALVVNRVRWMDETGIKQWNVTNYLKAYPKSYYEKQIELGNLYVLRSDANRRILGAAVLLERDDNWLDRQGGPAYYIHNLVTDISEKGAGKLILNAIQDLAIQNGKHYLRLDCAADSQFLNTYYESMGFLPVGQCKEGLYIGNRREKALPLGTKGLGE